MSRAGIRKNLVATKIRPCFQPEKLRAIHPVSLAREDVVDPADSRHVVSTHHEVVAVNIKSMFRSSMLACVFAGALVSGTVMAQSATPDQTLPGHGRVNEVNKRLDNQQNRVQNGVTKGQINATQAARDETHTTNIAQRESVDEAKHNGHLTKPEQHRLNRAENRNSRHIRRQRH